MVKCQVWEAAYRYGLGYGSMRQMGWRKAATEKFNGGFLGQV